MTTRYTISIHCDRCAEWVEAAPATKPSGISGTLVKQLKRQGWSRVTNSQFTDLCPKCLKDSYRVMPGAEAPKVPAGYTAEELERDNPYNAWMNEQ